MARIHIVGGDASIRQLAMYHLVEDGHELSAAKDGKDVLQTLALDAPDLMILDVTPAGAGLDLLAEIDGAGLQATTRILVVGPSVSEHDRERALASGAHCYLSKPFDGDDLIKMVRDLLDSTLEQLSARRERERDTSHLLSQLETLLGE